MGMFVLDGVSISMGLLIELFNSFALVDEDRGTVLVLATASIAIPIYLVVMRLLVQMLTGEKRRCRDFIGRGIIGSMAFLLWSILSDLGRAFMDVRANADPLWDSIPIFGSMFLAWAFYCIGCGMIPEKSEARKRQRLN